MTDQTLVALRFLAIGFLCGLVFLPLLKGLSRRKSNPRIPTVLGCAVPLAAHEIDFSKRYKLYTGSRFSDSPSEHFSGVRIVGYVEKEDREGGKFYRDWIVGELPDGRKLYLMPGSIQFMEEMIDGQNA